MTHSKLDIDSILETLYHSYNRADKGHMPISEAKQALLEAFEQSLPAPRHIPSDNKQGWINVGFNDYRNEAIKVIRGE